MKFPSTTTRSVRNENVGRRSRLRANLSLPLGSLLTSELVSSSTRGLHPDRLAMHSCRHLREDGEEGEEEKNGRAKKRNKKGGEEEEEEEEEQSGDSKRFLEIYKRDKKRKKKESSLSQCGPWRKGHRQVRLFSWLLKA